MKEHDIIEIVEHTTGMQNGHLTNRVHTLMKSAFDDSRDLEALDQHNVEKMAKLAYNLYLMGRDGVG